MLGGLPSRRWVSLRRGVVCRVFVAPFDYLTRAEFFAALPGPSGVGWVCVYDAAWPFWHGLGVCS